MSIYFRAMEFVRQTFSSSFICSVFWEVFFCTVPLWLSLLINVTFSYNQKSTHNFSQHFHRTRAPLIMSHTGFSIFLLSNIIINDFWLHDYDSWLYDYGSDSMIMAPDSMIMTLAPKPWFKLLGHFYFSMFVAEPNFVHWLLIFA